MSELRAANKSRPNIHFHSHRHPRRHFRKIENDDDAADENDALLPETA
jgi:hypothetical protein